MSQDIAKYVEIVGEDKIKHNLKHDLKTELTKAIATENWLLVREITELIEKVFNDNVLTSKQDLIRCVEIISIQKSNINLKNYLIQAIESEEWQLVQEISEILGNYLDCDRDLEVIGIKNLLKTILSESIKEEDWCLAEQITDWLKNHYSSTSNSIIESEDTKKYFKQALNKLIKVNKYDLTNEIVAVIQKNVIEYVREVEILKQETEALTQANQLDSLKAERQCGIPDKGNLFSSENYRTVDVDFIPSSFASTSCNTKNINTKKHFLKHNSSQLNIKAEEGIDSEIDDVLETMEDLHDVVVFHLDETRS